MKKYQENLIKTLLLTIAVFIIHYISDITNIEALAMTGILGWVILFFFYATGLFFALRGINEVI